MSNLSHDDDAARAKTIPHMFSSETAKLKINHQKKSHTSTKKHHQNHQKLLKTQLPKQCLFH